MDISNIENQAEHFRKIMKQHSDEELVKVLRQRRHYQQEAARQAVLEAINRGLINTEADLQDSRFSEIPVKLTFFPKVENQKVRNKLWKSISRSLLITGVIPLVWATVSRNSISLIEILVLIIYGLLWIYISFRLMQTQNLKLAYALLLLLVPGLIYYVRAYWAKSFPVITDILIPLVLIIFILYGIGYLRKLKS